MGRANARCEDRCESRRVGVDLDGLLVGSRCGFSSRVGSWGRWEFGCGRLRGTAVGIKKLARKIYCQAKGWDVSERTMFRLLLLIAFIPTPFVVLFLSYISGMRGTSWFKITTGVIGFGFFGCLWLGRRKWIQRKERFRASVRSANGDICPVCHYPMRVAVGERCPECGTVMDMMRIAKWRLWWRGGVEFGAAGRGD